MGKTIKLLMLALILVLGTFHANLFAIVIHDGAMNDPAWQQEYKDLGASYPSVVALYGSTDGKGWGCIGSGTIIGDGSYVIGAAHSALLNGGSTYPYYAVVTGNNLASDYWGIYYTSSVAVHPAYTAPLVSTDLAVWSFDAAFPGITPASLYTGSDAALIGTLITTVGFGYTGYASTGGTVDDYYKRGCVNELYRLGFPSLGGSDDQLVQYFTVPELGTHLGGSAAAFDSGGGYFLYGTDILSGVHNSSIEGNGYGSFDSGTSISQNIDWISATIPEPCTLVIFALGGLGITRRRRAACRV